MSEYRIVKAELPGYYNVERRRKGEATFKPVAFAAESVVEAQRLVDDFKKQEAAGQWNPGEVVWEE